MFRFMKKCCIALFAIGMAAMYAAEKDLKLGVYVYDYAFKRVADANGEAFDKFIDRHFKILRDHGVNAIHLTVGDPTGKKYEQFWQPALRKHGIKAYLQLDFAYYIPNKLWTDAYESRQAEKAGKFIAKYKKCPEILAFSVREEVQHAHVNGLARYYQKIMEHAQDFPILNVQNNLAAARDLPVPDPAVYGTDRYAFWWEYSAGGYMASPDFSLNWVRNQAKQYYPEAAKRGADFIFVVTANGFLSGTFDLQRSWGKSKVLPRIKKYIDSNRFGWKKSNIGGKDFYWSWKYYRLPPNCMRALMWTGIMEGAKSFLVWSYTPVANKDMKLTPEQAIYKGLNRWKNRANGNAVWTTLAGRDGIENYELKEFAATAKELAPYRKLIPMMHKVEKSIVKTNARKKFFNRSFTFSGMKGKAIVIHNAKVGTWGANSRYFFKETDDIKIDALGRMACYKPLTVPVAAEFTLNDANTPVFDFKTGKRIAVNGGKGTVKVAPGGGVILFAGSEQEFNRIRAAIR